MYGIAQPIGILVRMLAVLLLVTGTYNPSGYSYYHWAFHTAADQWAAKTLIGMLLSIPLLAVIGTGIWLLSVWDVIDLSDGLQRTLVLEASITLLLGTGVSFSLIRYRLSG